MKKERVYGWRLLRRYPEEDIGKAVDTGTLEELRSKAEELALSLPDSTILYITTERPGYYGSTIYQGWEVLDGQLVESYRKYPSRSGKGRFSSIGWGNDWTDRIGGG
jgi:hypothetical protein